ncbi:hypothetical protein [Streptomyces sp. UH6]|uniref:hypothetical protein n=1 Tax=Streptomyces sp. UH6 TaxID=2748379 RepID=UPI0015D4AB15|nr:hypothetical protein [Streptomyces sp. UH6]NYV75751.1 hypothetical protein [Streptomyces sp. UH6]
MDWRERARAAEQGREWEVAIALVSAHAECHSNDPDMHDSHLWHMDLLARAARYTELTARALDDGHARRALNRSLGERGMDAALRRRAEDGDRGALYVLVRLLCRTSRVQEAQQAVEDIGPEDQYARRLVAEGRRA